MARHSSTESGASASFLDLLCCALGGVILLVVMFSTRIKPGDATEQADYLVAEFDLLLKPGSNRQETVQECRPVLEVLRPRPVSLNYRTHPELNSEREYEFDYRWLTTVESRADGEHALVHLVLTQVDESLSVRPGYRMSPSVTNARVTLYSKKRIQLMDGKHEFNLQVE